MPNWCNNYVEIKGPTQKLQALSKAAKAGELLNFMYPMPQELEQTEANGTERPELVKKTGHSDWYSWRTTEWHTKWDVGECHQNDIADGVIRLSFDTAWAPGTGAYENYLAENQDISIRAHYYEPGCDFMGTWDDYEDDCVTISEVTDEELTTEYQHLDDYFGILESREMWREEQKEEENANG